MEHIEFIDHDHFEYQYHRQWASGKLLSYIDFCWETDFSQLLEANPEGFSDVLFPNIGYTYLINLGTPFVMQLEKNAYEVKIGGFLPRHHYISCRHSVGNQLFGIKFKVCPVLFEKSIDFSEYREHIFPLAYLIDKNIIAQVRSARSFTDRVGVIFNYYNTVIEKYEASLQYVQVVTGIIQNYLESKQYNIPIDALAKEHGISIRTIQRYFQACTGFGPKQALQTMRVRQAIQQLTMDPGGFDYRSYGYYDYSHFSKHLKQFAGEKYYKHFLQYYGSGKQVR